MSDPIVSKIATEIHDTMLKMNKIGKGKVYIIKWLRGLTHERLGWKYTKELRDSGREKYPKARDECEE